MFNSYRRLATILWTARRKQCYLNAYFSEPSISLWCCDFIESFFRKTNVYETNVILRSLNWFSVILFVSITRPDRRKRSSKNWQQWIYREIELFRGSQNDWISGKLVGYSWKFSYGVRKLKYGGWNFDERVIDLHLFSMVLCHIHTVWTAWGLTFGIFKWKYIKTSCSMWLRRRS